VTGALRRLALLAAPAALAAWALAVGRWLRAPDAGASLLGLVVVTAVLAVALGRLYRPGGVTALRWPAEADDRMDLNAAGAAELVRLPGVGPVLAERIMAEREAGGPFTSVEDLTRVPGLGPARVRALAGQARAG
jgi:competence ComEA-like helix-hairpin-helix protein